MSVRIHQISKKTGIANKDLIALLQERGFNVTSASSSIDNISAESLIEELSEAAASGTDVEAAAPGPDVETAAPDKESDTSPETPADPEDTGEMKTEPPSPRPGGLPPGVFVKSADDVRREREEKEEARKKPQASVPAPSPQSAPPPPPPPSKPQATPPPPAPAARSAPAPKAPPRPGGSPPAPPSFPGVKPAASPAAETPADRTGESGDEGEDGEREEASPEAAEELRILQIKPPVVVRDFAQQLGIKPFRLISELMEMNIFASMNQVIDESVAQDVAEKHGYLLEVKHRKAAAAPGEKARPEEKIEVDESKFLEPRPPVVCILGHVDHGKTTLLDYIRKENVAGGEEGGITQHIGAYQIEVGSQRITFLDTPGHAAFTKMRARGAGVTDIAILVVAADDGFMPQTDEALKHAQAAAVPVIVAVNKMDVKGADLDRVKRQMQERGIPPEDLGGETIVVPISAIKGEGIDSLLEMILLQSEILELKANPQRAAEGMIIESEIEVGRGPSATVIVQHGTLKTGASVVCGSSYAKVRAMFDDSGATVKQAPPSTPVRVIGWTDAPEVGGTFRAVKNERDARRQVEEAQIDAKRRSGAEPEGGAQPKTLENLFEAIENTRKKTFRVIVRCDVQGSVEAVTGLLETIESDKIDLEILQGDVGMITRNDVLMASAAEAAIIGFNVKLEPGVPKFAKHHNVPIYQFGIIYHLVDQVKEILGGMLDPEYVENKLGAAEVRQVFPVAKKIIAGCLVTEGKIVRDRRARILREGEVIAETRIDTVKRFKDDATEVRAGLECGIGLDKFNRFQEGDVIECFEVQEKRPSL